MLTVASIPQLDLRAFLTEFPQPLGAQPTPAETWALFAAQAAAPFASSDELRKAVRNLLRQAGFQPTGRSKPSSEYLLKAAAEKSLASINLAVDVGNIVSLHSGLPISVVDLARGREPWTVALAPAGAEYVFNASGQVIQLAGLMCLHDADGPCANAVKDAQRTKTTPDTQRTLTVIWGTTAFPTRAAEAERWARDLLEYTGATTQSAFPP